MRIHLKQLLLFIPFSLFTILSAQEPLPKVYINEFMASNSQTIQSPDFNEYADWLEIYNAEDTTVSIGGLYLTDDFSEPQKWLIPSVTIIDPGMSILFWADGYDQGQHTNFSLASGGEEIGLFTAAGQVIDTIRYSEQIPDVSFGRYPDGTENLFFFAQPTPAASNIFPGFNGLAADPLFSANGGFYQGPLLIEISSNSALDTIRYTLDGSLPDTQSSVYTAAIELDSTTVIRARVFRQSYLPGNVISNTYFINETTTLPLVSIATNPASVLLLTIS